MRKLPLPALAAALALASFAHTRAQTNGNAGYAWQFEIIQPFDTPDCVPTVVVDDLKIDPANRRVAVWRESGCDIPYTPEQQGFKWARRDAQAPMWTINSIVNQTCGFLGCRGLRGDPPALAIRPDGTPFYLYGREGQFEYIRVATINLDENPTGLDPDLGEWLAQYQSSDSWPRLAASFPANVPQALPNYVRGSTSGVTLNGTPNLTSTAANPLRYVNGPDGQHHIVFYGNNGEGWRYYYSDGAPEGAHAIPILGGAESTGLSIAADASNTLHVALTGAPDDYNWFWSTLLYLTRDHSGVWNQHVVVDGRWNSNRNPSIALDSAGHPGIAYWRYPDEIRLARFDGTEWSDRLITRTGSALSPVTAPKLAFDHLDRPVVAFYHVGTNALMTATGEPAVPASFLVDVYGAGSGVVSSLPAGLACPGVCASTVPDGSVVALIATPAINSVFVGWTGACSGSGTCVATASGLQSIGARFEIARPRHHIALTTTAQFGSGSDCTLGDAIRAANTDAAVNGCAAGSGRDTIDLVAGTYTLNAVGESGYQGPNGLPAIYTDIEIRGAGAASTIIERAPSAPLFRIFDVTYYPAGARFSLSGVTVRSGSGIGGAMIVNAATEIADAVFEGHSAPGDYGGAIRVWNPAPLQIARTTFRNNYAASGGGAIATNGPLEISGGFFDANIADSNGGALLLSGTTTIRNTGFAHNQAYYGGGAIDNGGPLTMFESTLDANTASNGSGGAIANSSQLTLIDSMLNVNHAANGNGGGLMNGGQATMVRSSIVANHARHGGGVENGGSLTFENSTISSNRGSTGPGGVYNHGTLYLRSATVAFNVGQPGYGSGIYSQSGTVRIQNSVIGNNMTTPGEMDCYSSTGGFISDGYNFIAGDYNCLSSPAQGDQAAWYQTPIDPKLATAMAGSTTWTHAVLPGSPLINAGNPAEPGSVPGACPAVDQRGVARPQRGVCDIGAFEKTDELPIAVGQSVSTAEDEALNITLAASDLDGDPVDFTITVSPAHGFLTGTASALIYTPADDFYGSDSFSFAPTNAYGTGAAATIAIDVTPANDPPTAVNDAASVIQNGGPQSVDVLGNDSDAPDGGETLRITGVTSGLRGTTAIVASGSRLEYSPTPGFAGDDTFTYTIDDGHGATATATVAVSVRPSADLEVTVGSPSTVSAGEPFDYTITVTNHGPAVATAVEVVDNLSPNLTVFSSDCPRTGFVATCLVSGPMAPGTTREFKINVASPDYGYLPNSASVEAAEPDPNLSNNTAPWATLIIAGHDIGVKMTQSANPARAYETLTYYLRVFNRAGGSVSNVVVDDTLPDGVTFLRASPGCQGLGGLVICSQNELPLNNEVVFWIEVQPTQAGTILNRATVDASGADIDPSNDHSSLPTTIIAGRTDLAASIIAAPGLHAQNVYTATATNHGPSPATNVHLVLTIPEGLAPQSIAPTQGPCSGFDATARTLDCALGELGVQGSASVFLTADYAGNNAAFLVTAAVSANEEDPLPLNNQDSTKLAALRVTLSVPSGPLPDGATFTHLVRITNAGPSPAVNVTLVNRFADFTHAAAPPTNCTENGQTHFDIVQTCLIGTIPPFGTVEVSQPVTRKLPDSMVGGPQDYSEATANFKSRVSSDTPDPDTTDNEAQNGTTIYASADMKLTNELGPEPLHAGDRVRFVLTHTNLGRRSPGVLKIVDTIPEGSIYANFSGEAWQCTPFGRTVTCLFPWDLAPPPLGISVIPPPGGGPLTNTATITTSLVDPDLGNNTATVTVTPQFDPLIHKRAMVIVVEDNASNTGLVSWEKLSDQLKNIPIGSGAATADELGRLLGIPSLTSLVEQSLKHSVGQMLSGAMRGLEDGVAMPSCYREVLETISNGVITGDDPWHAFLNQYGEQAVGECLRDMAMPYYDHVELLTDTTASLANFKATLERLHREGYTIDMLLDQHGCGTPATMNNSECTLDSSYLLFNGGEKGWDYKLRDINNGNLRLGSVYMVSCWGAGLNQMWLDMGARESDGAQELNYYVLISPFAFVDHFTRHQMSLEQAARQAYLDERPLMAGTDLTLTLDFRWVIGCGDCVATFNLGPVYEYALNRVLALHYGANTSLPVNTTASSRRLYMTGTHTPVGTNQVATIVEPSSGAPLAEITFDSVTASGATSFTVVAEGPELPSGFRMGNPSFAYEISTTAAFTGSATVCIHYDPSRFPDESSLRLQHYVNNQWVDETVSHDPAHDVICARVTSFSPFAIVTPNHAPLAVNPGPQTSGQGQLVALQLAGTDIDDDYLTFSVIGLPPGLHLSADGIVGGVTTDQSVGAHLVTFTVSDGLASSAASFTWSVGATPGRMHGQGHLERSKVEHHFEFKVSETKDGADHGRIDVRTKGKDRFDGGVITAVTFAGHGVTFSGTGKWNGQAGYSFQASATDASEPGVGRDTFAITIKSPQGSVVLSISGTLAGGNVQLLKQKK